MPKTKISRRRQRAVETMTDRGFTQLTKWLPVFQSIMSQWGCLKIDEWVDYEARRLNASPEHKADVARADGMAAVFVWTSREMVTYNGER